METIYYQDTIAAIATAPGEGSVGILRISGPEALPIADRIFKCAGPAPSACASHTVVYGHVIDHKGRAFDEGLLLVMRAPRTYTREDVVEIQGHGGHIATRSVLRRAIEAGARPAEPGEFTRRAFLNGRIDLLQAEAVLDLVRSQSDRASAAALEQLQGGLSQQFDALYDGMMETAAKLEATLDFPEDELPHGILEGIQTDLAARIQQAEALLSTWDEGHLLRDGVLVVISGKPNAGKSTLLNALLKKDRAIVSEIPGTTRDSIEEMVILSGIPVRLVDTAGLRATECDVEKQGIARAHQYIQRADLHLYVLDASSPPDREIQAHLEALDPEKSLVICNKQDRREGRTVEIPDALHTIPTSLSRGEGLEPLIKHMVAKLAGNADLSARPHGVISERHRTQLKSALVEMHTASAQLEHEGEEALVLAASQLRLAMDAIGEATGRVYQETLLDTIFSRFCIGK